MCIKINKIGKQVVGIWWVQKRFPRYGVPIWSLWPNIRFLPSIVTEKKVTKNVHKNHISRQTWSRNLTGPTTLPTIWYTYMTLVIIIKYNYTDKTQIKNTLMTLAIFWYSKFDYLKWLNVKLLTNNVFSSTKHLDDLYFWNQ